MPLYRRLAQAQHFTLVKSESLHLCLNRRQTRRPLAAWQHGQPRFAGAAGLVTSPKYNIPQVLGDGDLGVSLTSRPLVHQQCREKIEAAGGSCELIA